MPTEGAPRLLPWRPAATTCDGTSRAAADGGVGRVEVPRQNGAGTRRGAGDRACGHRLVNAPCVRGVGPTWQRRPTDAGARVWRTAARVPRPLCSGALPSFPSFKMSSSPWAPRVGMNPMTYQFLTFGISAIRTCLLAYQPGLWHTSRRLAHQPGIWRISQDFGISHRRASDIWHIALARRSRTMGSGAV